MQVLNRLVGLDVGEGIDTRIGKGDPLRNNPPAEEEETTATLFPLRSLKRTIPDPLETTTIPLVRSPCTSPTTTARGSIWDPNLRATTGSWNEIATFPFLASSKKASKVE